MSSAFRSTAGRAILVVALVGLFALVLLGFVGSSRGQHPAASGEAVGAPGDGTGLLLAAPSPQRTPVVQAADDRDLPRGQTPFVAVLVAASSAWLLARRRLLPIAALGERLRRAVACCGNRGPPALQFV
jgi:hypothetical protein